jgi:hypothetical protein
MQTNSLLIEEGAGEGLGGVVLIEAAALFLPFLEFAILRQLEPRGGCCSTTAMRGVEGPSMRLNRCSEVEREWRRRDGDCCVRCERLRLTWLDRCCFVRAKRWIGWSCGSIDSSLQWFAARSAGSADSMRSMVLHLCEIPLAELTEIPLGRRLPIISRNQPQWGTYTQR